jgi:hypothetical protein
MTSSVLANSKYLQGRLLALIDPTREANRVPTARCARLEVRSLSTRLRTVSYGVDAVGRARRGQRGAPVGAVHFIPFYGTTLRPLGFSDNSHRTVLVYGFLRCLWRRRHSSIDVHSVVVGPSNRPVTTGSS